MNLKPPKPQKFIGFNEFQQATHNAFTHDHLEFTRSHEFQERFASAFEPESWEFESPRARHLISNLQVLRHLVFSYKE